MGDARRPEEPERMRPPDGTDKDITFVYKTNIVRSLRINDEGAESDGPRERVKAKCVDFLESVRGAVRRDGR